jgi:hypothetical protein
MKKILIIALLLATSKLVCQNETKNELKNWNVSLSNAIFGSQIANVQLEVERKIKPNTSVGLYLQFLNYDVTLTVAPWVVNYDQNNSWQFGFQSSSHFFRPENKWDLYFKWRAGVNITNRDKKLLEMMGENRVFTNFEAGLGVGLSRQISNGFSIFFEPGLSGQFFRPGEMRGGNKPFLQMNTFWLLRYGVTYSF